MGWTQAEDRHQRQPADTDHVLFIVICRIQSEQFGLFEESSARVLLVLIRFSPHRRYLGSMSRPFQTWAEGRVRRGA